VRHSRLKSEVLLFSTRSVRLSLLYFTTREGMETDLGGCLNLMVK